MFRRITSPYVMSTSFYYRSTVTSCLLDGRIFVEVLRYWTASMKCVVNHDKRYGNIGDLRCKFAFTSRIHESSVSSVSGPASPHISLHFIASDSGKIRGNQEAIEYKK